MKSVKKICVLQGGCSPEREISFVSGKAYFDALKSLGYEVNCFDFSGNVNSLVNELIDIAPDCVVNALHGGSGENGCVQALLDMMKIPYSHSGVLASSVAMNKKIACAIFNESEIRVANNCFLPWTDLLLQPSFKYPFVVKPFNGGSSAGVHIINNFEELKNLQWEFGSHVFVEEYIPGIELTVGVMGDKPLEVTKICVQSGFYDYRNKYAIGASIHELPAKIPDSVRKLALDYALRAHRLLGCSGISRSDFRYNDVTGDLFMLELNSQPGMTPTSLFPEQASFVGISFNDLVQWIVEQACFEE